MFTPPLSHSLPNRIERGEDKKENACNHLGHLNCLTYKYIIPHRMYEAIVAYGSSAWGPGRGWRMGAGLSGRARTFKVCDPNTREDRWGRRPPHISNIKFPQPPGREGQHDNTTENFVG